MEEHLSSLFSICGRVLVFNDHSTDDTVKICEQFASRITVITSPWDTLNEARDKTFLVSECKKLFTPSWIVFLDSDEILMDAKTLRMNIDSHRGPAYSMRIWSCWDSPHQVRTDGIYGKCWRSSCFQVTASNCQWREHTPDGPNLHCCNIPSDLHGRSQRTFPEVRIKHYGYMLREDRIRKYEWYLNNDPANIYTVAEDGYRHSVQGDLPQFPASARYRHGGPLTLRSFPEQSMEPLPRPMVWVGNQQVPV